MKPKKISVGRPFRFLSVTAWPDWSVSWNGPPIAAGVAIFFRSPISQVISSSPMARLAAKAVMMTTGRLSRSIQQLPIQKQAAMPAAIISKNTAVP